MARKPLVRSKNSPYHVCVRSNNRDWFEIPLPAVWEIFRECLERTQARYDCEYYAFVLMGNHIHLMICTPRGNLGEAMRYLLTETSRRLARATGRINRIFGARYKWSVLHDPVSYAYVLKYILRNPVRAGITSQVECYPFSTLTRAYAGASDIPIASRCDRVSSHIPRETSMLLSWLNQPTPKECEALIGLGLRRFEFRFPKGHERERELLALRRHYGVEI